MDDELTKSFLELQGKIVETNRQLRVAHAQAEAAERAGVRASLTTKELAQLTPETRTYKSVGRAFLFQPVQQVLEELESVAAKSKVDVVKFQKSASYHERSLKDYEAQMRETVAALQKNQMAKK
ncbi:hypothetical protein CAOG_01512 [Capsaspora owczarzaki ATCC 30864]|uniref:Prefoldin subunit 1 n=1 Tax=Capsaspora owczarzaki (strain ATCC 30864) TaxID=595528 RepID=A0A0D2U4U9_CAPO3|nr:hypothetical protein CAOG_01512 [Capsaspora owczarzaki ATCC 30864]KJE90166.1 hypothetical protein CAOG_001512 [Capsaspora owczarzaki ATCC 30864]|eukprot:XP_004364380.1 hypothetical protein CAOG_01512 [Capsaspora owczarzaki ATCC 30864]